LDLGVHGGFLDGVGIALEIFDLEIGAILVGMGGL
jgi:hypothetical protein